MASGITALFTTPFFTGAGTTQEVPSLYPIGLNGRGYMVDLKSGLYRRQSIQILRGQADTGNLPGEQSVNPDDLWRRSQQTWSKGAGQRYLDRADSDPARFYQSKGIDVWEKWELTLLPDTDSKASTAGTNLFLAVAGSRLYYTEGNSTKFTTDVSVGSPSFTTVTGTPAAAASSITSDGFNVYIGYTSNGVYSTNTGTSAAAQLVTSAVTPSVVRYVKGRLMVAVANSIYNVTSATPAVLPAALLTHANTSFTWVDFAEGQNVLYAAGYSGDKSLIYKTTVKPDGTALDTPSVAGELPDGEVVRSMQGYLGFLLIGTDFGVRFCTADGQGNLTIGPLLNTGRVSVRCFEPQDRFVWFGWTNYDSGSTGLGRADLSVFTSPLAPAFASDLMVTGQGIVQSVATVFHGGRELRVFTVSGLGLYGEETTLVAEGTLDTGQFTYGIPDEKVGMYVDVRSEPLGGTLSAAVSLDGGDFELLGADSVAGSIGSTFQVGQERARRFEVRLILNRDGSVTSTGPTIIRITLRAYPAPNRGEIFTVPLIFHETLTPDGHVTRPLNPLNELDFIRGLILQHQLVTFQEAGVSHAVFVEDFEYQYHHPTRDKQFWNGLCVVRLKEVIA